MQETRWHILEILKARGQATVDDLVVELQNRRGSITPVTVRHHLKTLLREQLIATVDLRHRTTPGRPQHVYTLTETAKSLFPSNYHHLVDALLNQLRQQLPPDGVNVIMEGVARDMARQVHMPDLPLMQRVDIAVEYLNRHGYDAHYEITDAGYILHTTNCPYHHVARNNTLLCDMDMRLVAELLGVVPRLLHRISDGSDSCAYLIPLQVIPSL